MSSEPSSSHAEHLPRTVTILYATETGNAQDIADRIARECRRIHLKAQVDSMEAYSPSELISEHMVIFVVSTTGSGKEPRAMKSLWTMLLRSDLPDDLFEDLAFAVFGLGDTAYEKFCWPAKLLSRRLLGLGAAEICPRGEGDEQHHFGIDGAFGPWIAQLSELLLQFFPLPVGLEAEPIDSLPPARVSIRDADGAAVDEYPDPLLKDLQYHTGTVSCNRRITAEDWYQDVRHFEFEFDEDILYNPGDVAVIHPEAMPADVEAFLVSIGYTNTADYPIIIHRILEVSTRSSSIYYNSSRIVYSLSGYQCCASAVFFTLLKHFVTEEHEVERLTEFLSEEGADELYEYCQRPRRTIREVFEEFRSARIPRDYIFDLFPPLRPRQFSIASSVKARRLYNISGRFGCRSKAASRIPERSAFFATRRLDARDLRWSRHWYRSERAVIEERTHAGFMENTLYFGCRSASKDQHYHLEWNSLAKRGALTYRAAFSRDGPEGQARTYVQHLIREDAQRVWELVGERGAWVYISGSSNKMPAAVKAAIQYAAEKEGGKSQEEAQEFIAMLDREGRLTEESLANCLSDLFQPASMAPAPPPFDRNDADVVLRSSDGVHFHVHKTILVIASPVFEGMFNVPQPATLADEDIHSETGLPLLVLTEDRRTLENLLRLFQAVLIAARKYSIDDAVVKMGERLLPFIPQDPLRVYAIACSMDLPEEAEAAARASPDIILMDSENFKTSGLDQITSGQYFRLMDFLRRRKNGNFEYAVPKATTVSETITTPSSFLIPHLSHHPPDTILRSSDGVDFHVHNSLLSMLSPVLAGLFKAESSSTETSVEGLHAIALPEDSQTLTKLLQFCYPMETPELESFDVISAVLEAGRRYQIMRAIDVAEREWKRAIRKEHLRAYYFAMKCSWMDEAKVAARYMVFHTLDSHAPEMDEVPAEAYRRILEYRRQCQASIIAVFGRYGVYIQGQLEIDPYGINTYTQFWRKVYSDMIIEVLYDEPCSNASLVVYQTRFSYRALLESSAADHQQFEEALRVAVSQKSERIFCDIAEPASQQVTYCGFLTVFRTRGLLVPTYRLTIYIHSRHRLSPNLFNHHHDMAPASSPFDRADVDIILRSSDGIDFRAHKILLAMSSPLFDGMFNIHGGSSNVGVPSTTMLSLPTPILEDLGDVSAVMEAAKKYHVDDAIARMSERLLAFVPKEPLRVYAIACYMDLEAEAEVAAKAAPDTISLDLESFNQLGFNRITSGQLFRLMDFLRRRWTGGAAEFTDPIVTPPDSATSRDKFVMPHLQIPNESPDIIIRSSDGVDFHVHSHVLSVISTGLLPASLDKDSTEDARTIDVPEDSRSLSTLLQLCYPMRSPRLESLDATQAVLEAARRYRIVRVVEIVEKEWVKFLPQEHLRAYFIAMKHGWMDGAKEAAKYAACHTVDRYVADMDGVPAEAYRRLFDYRKRCQDTFIHVIEQRSGRSCFQSCSSFNGIRSFAPFWSDVFSG
ncbi:NADPH-dependent diflavin oxidoreductase 1 [Grifola frondosa]|uniref:NADPH-dependent diflavin oxidoreductase 1 n=1 Tax=Grifola frondosa TaxID=5627 RepID=A0A1C7MDQ3_GRIFR|nr:NADPH-dependent diflavin oxidoreductase 1 [Grifola frondosa]